MGIKSKKGWNFAIDRGGTFTDVIGLSPSGGFRVLKLLSRSPEYDDPVSEGIRRVLEIPSGQNIPDHLIGNLRIGTTVATNALLERKGGRVLLLITEGFRDLLEIGFQQRLNIFGLKPERPEPLYDKVIEVPERIASNGDVLTELVPQALQERLKGEDPCHYDAVAVVFMNSWKNPSHELLAGELLEKSNFRNIFLSHQTSNEIGIVSRGLATVVDAYLHGVLTDYKEKLNRSLCGINFSFFTSAGEITPPDEFRGRDALLSGPAGGVVGIKAVSEEIGLTGAIGFDMGGTSTDVSRYDGKIRRVTERVINGITVKADMIDINTVAAGGSSILWFDGERLRVGPDSAGALPGPACYGFGGPLTITDANLLTGRLPLSTLPETFGPERNSLPLISETRRGFESLLEEVNHTLKLSLTPEELALGFIEVANEKMASAIKEVSISEGVDIRDYSLICFGGAGGQHACSIASALEMKEVIFHPLSSLFSAYGIGLSPSTKKTSKTFIIPFTENSVPTIVEEFKRMEEEAGLSYEVVEGVVVRELDLRVKGTERHITVELKDYAGMIQEFAEEHKGLFGFFRPDAEVETITLRSRVITEGPILTHYSENSDEAEEGSTGETDLFTNEGWIRIPLIDYRELCLAGTISGPCIIKSQGTSFFVEKEFRAEALGNGIIRAVRKVKEARKSIDVQRPDPVLLEVFHNAFAEIATEMGHILRNTSHSVNMKERLDFSCAIFDRNGDLVANAPHIPVHLGAMGDTVKAILKRWRGEMRPGDVFASNNPYDGGTHLPDVTVVMPVFDRKGEEIIFFTASRGHHSDMGGIVSGSMPPEATHIDQEGVLIDSIAIVRNGEIMEDEIRAVFTHHKYPVRELEERVGDLVSQIASCKRGERELLRLIERYGVEVVTAYMGFIQENADRTVQRALWRLLGGESAKTFRMSDRLDDGTLISVEVRIEAGDSPPETTRAVVDFTGTSPQHNSDNLNAPLSVTRSAVLYFLRTITGEEIPLNSGCLKSVEVIVPEGSLLNPLYPAPVASGNVETSQRIVDILFGATGIAAASQGTMNNLLFCTKTGTPYYETIGGGAGASIEGDGTNAIQVHMTNTRLTDPEILEFRQPGIRLERFHIREGSGGKGRFSGGNGTVREIRFLEDAEVTIISERRRIVPFGLKGGSPGSPGRNIHFRRGGGSEELPHRVTLQVQAGDSIRIETPGGGGYGA